MSAYVTSFAKIKPETNASALNCWSISFLSKNRSESLIDFVSVSNDILLRFRRSSIICNIYWMLKSAWVWGPLDALEEWTYDAVCVPERLIFASTAPLLVAVCIATRMWSGHLRLTWTLALGCPIGRFIWVLVVVLLCNRSPESSRFFLALCSNNFNCFCSCCDNSHCYLWFILLLYGLNEPALVSEINHQTDRAESW